MKKKAIFVGVAIVAALSVFAIMQPGCFDPVCRLVGFTDTVYAPGFSRSRFSRVSIGMPRSEVETLLGRGFRDFNAPSADDPGEPDQPRWFYSAGAGNHWRFWITFDEKDTVSKIQRELWWD